MHILNLGNNRFDRLEVARKLQPNAWLQRRRQSWVGSLLVRPTHPLTLSASPAIRIHHRLPNDLTDVVSEANQATGLPILCVAKQAK